MNDIIIIILFVLLFVLFGIVSVLVVTMKKIAYSLNSIAYIMKNNGVNLETKNDIAKVAIEVSKAKDRIKKLEATTEVTKNKLDNVAREVSAKEPLYYSKRLL